MANSMRAESVLRQILVPLDSKIAAKNTIETAFMIAKTLTSHVKILLISQDPTRDEGKYPPNVVDRAPPDGTIRLRHNDDIAQQRWQEIRRIVDSACAHHSCLQGNGEPSTSQLSATIETETGEPAAVVSRHGRYADLIVFAKPTSVTRMSSSVRCSAALFETGRPIVVTPSTSSVGFGRRIAIAWNNVAEDSRAVAAAIPFLKRADSVIAMTAGTAGTAESLADYLETHGIESEARVFPNKGNPPLGGLRLLEECAKVKADLLVMGAPRPGRFRERELGSAIREILDGTSIPVLMSR